MSKTACASIRFDPQGRVAEVSGLADGSNQTIEDSLIPIVEQEVFKYPLDPDQHFKERFRDKKELIRLQDKAKKSEDLTLDEYAFLYEKNREIFTLDTYGGPDKKIKVLRDIYNLSRLFQNENVDTSDKDLLKQKIECIYRQTNITDILQNIDNLLNYGISIDPIFNVMESRDVSNNLDTLLSHGISIDSIFNKINGHITSNNLDTLLNYNVSIDSIFNKMNSYSISNNLDVLLSHGISIDSIFGRMDSSGISGNLDTLLSHGISIDSIFNKMNHSDISQNLDALLSHGISIDAIFNKMDSYDVSYNLDFLRERGIPLSSIISKMNIFSLENHLNTFERNPDNIRSIQKAIYRNIPIESIEEYILENIDMDGFCSKLLDENLDSILGNGSLELTMKTIVKEDLPDTFNKFLDEHPIDYSSMEPEIYSHFTSEIIESFEDTDYSAKLNDDRIVKLLIGSDLIDNLDSLLQVMPIGRIVANMRPADIETYHDELVAHGATL